MKEIPKNAGEEVKSLRNVCYSYNKWEKEHFFRNMNLTILFIFALPYLVEFVKGINSKD